MSKWHRFSYDDPATYPPETGLYYVAIRTYANKNGYRSDICYWFHGLKDWDSCAGEEIDGWLKKVPFVRPPTKEELGTDKLYWKDSVQQEERKDK